MRRWLLALLALASAPVDAGRARVLLDFDWRFHLGDIPDGSATKPTYNDTTWRLLDVPHDFVVEGNFTQSADMSHGYLPYGIGWYRKHFVLPENYKGQTMWLDFDGTYRNTQIWLNGALLGGHQSGYASYRFRIDNTTGLVIGGGDNVLVVRCDSTQPEGWWYDGGGIYRHVWLNAADPVHVAPWGVYAPATVQLATLRRVGAAAAATVEVAVQVEVVNDGTAAAACTVTNEVLDASGASAGKATSTETVPAGATVTVVQNITIAAAQLWSVDDPKLYKIVTTLEKGGAAVDEVTTVTGFRRIQFDAARGFLLNGQPVKVKGLANHQDFAGLGVAVPDNMQGFRVAQLKSMGGNAWRTAHNPPTPALLDACDRLGFLVWDENHYNRASDPAVLEDVRLMTRRDRNHPSIIMWSICNEALCEGFDATSGKVIRDLFHSLDATRPVTAAMNGGYGDPFSQLLDVEGFNYHPDGYDGYHRQFPNQPMIGSETSSCVSDRGIYENDAVRAYVSAYDVNAPGWGQTAEQAWQPIAQRSFVAGGFVWTGFDYKGEPTPYQWPNINSHFGIHDIAGFPKDNFWYYKSVWGPADPMVHVVPGNWNWQNTTSAGWPTARPLGTERAAPAWQEYSGFDSYAGMNFGPNLVTASPQQCETACEQRAGCTGFVQCSGTCYFRNERPASLASARVASAGCNLYVDQNATSGIAVWVYSNADEVELFLNGNSLGRKPFPALGHLEWGVKYAPGTLKATAYRNGQAVATDTVVTTGAPAALKLTIDWGVDGIEANNQDVALLRVAVLDKDGNVVPDASNPIVFTVETPTTGRVIGVGNGDPSSHEPDKSSKRSAWNGLARAVVQATHAAGSITVTATSPGLQSATVTVQSVEPVHPTPFL